MIDSVLIIANGEFSPSPQQLDEIRISPYLIAVDGGIDHCLRHNLRPHLLVGDFDSVSKDSLAKVAEIPKITLPSEKDQTDLEVALEKALDLTEGPIAIFGALGKRTDHTLYNLYLLARAPSRVLFEAAHESLFILRGKNTFSTHPGQTISLIPWGGAVSGVTTQGLKWELDNADFNNNWMSVSNICLGQEVTISTASGDLLCILQT